MGLFDRVERKLERVVNGAFARAFKAEVQPVEIASAMRRAMDDRAAVVSKGRTLVPNDFTVELSSSDHQRLTAYQDMLTGELIASAQEHIESQRYAPGGPLNVRFATFDDLETGVFRVRANTGIPRASAAVPAPAQAPPPARAQQAEPEPAAHPHASPGPYHVPHPPEATAPAEGAAGMARRAATAAEGALAGTAAARAAARAAPPAPGPAPAPPSVPEPPPAPTGPNAASAPTGPAAPTAPAAPLVDPTQRPWLDLDGDTYPLLGALTVLGRDSSADITLDDAGISRRHAELRVTNDGPHLVITIRDLGSTNGTYVNGERVTSRRLVDGDRVTVGRMSFHIRTPRR